MLRRMNTTRRRFLLLPLLLVALSAFLPAAGVRAGDDDRDHEEARALLQRGEILPLAHVLELVRGIEPGDVIEVELDRDDGVWEYQVKVLTPTGRVREVTLDARDGRLLKLEDD